MPMNRDQLKQIAVRTMTSGGVKSKQAKDMDTVIKGRVSTVKKGTLDILALFPKR